MVYTFMNYDDFNSKYNDILKIAYRGFAVFHMKKWC